MPAAQAVPQDPQLALLVLRFTSQPSEATRLQSAKPASQVNPQAVPSQLAVAFGGTAHDAQDAPQEATSLLGTHAPLHRW